MARQDHLDILEKGVDEWNQWREENPETIPDLERAHLDRKDLRRADMWRAKLENALLFEAKLQGATLKQAKLKGAYLERANFQGASLILADLDGAKLPEADLRNSNISNANLSNARLLHVKYNNKMKCRNVITAGCTGSQRFIRHVKDLDYIAEVKENHWWYWVWLATSNCGRSVWPWTAWSIGLVILFGVIFAQYPVWSGLSDGLQSTLTVMAPEMKYSNSEVSGGWFTPYYFSIVTFTTLGFGDVTPVNTAGQVWLTLEVVLGYIMLGGLISLFATKMTRQSG